MAKLNQAELETLITNGMTWTYSGLIEYYFGDQTQAMQIDRTLQKLRRAGKIAFKRSGRNVYWQAVPIQVASVTDKPAADA